MRSAGQPPRSQRLSYQHNDERRAVDGPLQRDVYDTIVDLHHAMEEPAALKGIHLELDSSGKRLVFRKQLPDVTHESET